jgi:hypothetical protein
MFLKQFAKAVEDAKKFGYTDGPISSHRQKDGIWWCTFLIPASLLVQGYCWWSCSFRFKVSRIHDVLSTILKDLRILTAASKATFDALLQMRRLCCFKK